MSIQSAKRSEERAARRSESGRFWAAADPRLVERIERHNRRLGRALHRVFHRTVMALIVCPLFYGLTRLFFRLRVDGLERLEGANRQMIIAARHFYEWDPLVTLIAVFYPQGLRDRTPHYIPIILAGHFWMLSGARRAISYVLGILGLVRGKGADQLAMRRAKELLDGRRGMSIAVFPTGPVRESATYDVKPGVARLALERPDVPVFPLTFTGIQGVSLRALLSLRRPTLALALGEPLYGREFGSGGQAEREERICDAIAASWRREESRIAEAIEAETGAPIGAPVAVPVAVPVVPTSLPLSIPLSAGGTGAAREL